MSLVQVQYCKFTNIEFRECKLTGVDWTKADWSNLSSGSDLNFFNPVVNGCSFYALDLQGIALTDCKCHDTDFREANLQSSDISGTDFNQSLFNNTNLKQADLTGATNYNIQLFSNEIYQAKFSRLEATRLLEMIGIELVD